MGTLAEYAARNPRPQPEPERQTMIETARSYNDRQEARETVEELKTSILQQLEQGNAPHIILSAAVRAIGILTHDTEWADAGQYFLDSVYADLEQQSLLQDNAAVALQRLDQMQADYNTKQARRLQTSFKQYAKLEKALNEAWNALTEAAPEMNLTKA